MCTELFWSAIAFLQKKKTQNKTQTELSHVMCETNLKNHPVKNQFWFLFLTKTFYFKWKYMLWYLTKFCAFDFEE